MPYTGETRNKILETALALFLTQGYEATSLREIAERVDLTKAALYYHYPAKEQIVIELTRSFLDGLADLVAPARSQRPADMANRRTELLSDYFDHLVDHHAVVDLLGKNPATQNHPHIGQRARNLVLALTAELAGPDASSEDKVRVACAIGAIHAVAVTSAAEAKRSRAVILGAALAALDAAPLPATRSTIRFASKSSRNRSAAVLAEAGGHCSTLPQELAISVAATNARRADLPARATFDESTKAPRSLAL